MDNNQNVDGLDGLPLESWMNPQHLSSVHPNLPAQIYHQPIGAQSIHDYMTNRTLQTFSAESLIHIGQSSQLVPPSARLHQSDLLSAAHDRSAWSHLLSMDPPTTSMVSHIPQTPESLRHCLPQDMPRSANTRQEPLLMLKGNASQLATTFENRSLPKMHFSLGVPSTADVSPVARNDTTQHFSQLMNLSNKITNTSRPPVPKTLAISNDVPSLESSGDYSPVSPVAPDMDFPNTLSSVSNSGRVVELLLREPHETSTSSAATTAFPLFSSSDHNDIFNYLSDKADPFLSDLGTQDCVSYSEPAESLIVSDFVPVQSDAPLDMRTVLGSKEGSVNFSKQFGQAEAGISVSREFSHSDPGIISEPEPLTGDKSSLLQTLLTKNQTSYLRESSNEAISATALSERKHLHVTVPIALDEKLTKPVKSTPKKSNFYGRDVSLFSFGPPSSFNSDAQSEIAENMCFLSSGNEVSSEAATKDQCEINNTEVIVASPTATSKINSNTSITHTESEMFPAEPVVDASLASSTNLPAFSTTSHAESIDGVDESFDMNETMVGSFSEANKADNIAKHDLVDGNSDNKQEFDNNIDNDMSQNVEGSSNVTEDHSFTPIISKIKVPKRKKRKATGFQARQRKKPARKQADTFDDDMVASINDHNTDMDGLDADISDSHFNENTFQQNATGTPKRRTRKSSKSSNSDTTPRRSSTRKSKDNAMRLIELQADSNYDGIPQREEITEKKSSRKRKTVLSNLTSNSDVDELSDFSDDDLTEEDKSDEKDFDYVVDEDEMNAIKNEEIIDEHSQNNKKSKEKKHGGLKISIKLSGNSSAEIVSGIEDFRSKKKKKSEKKKSVKIKKKNKLKSNKQVSEDSNGNEVENLVMATENMQEVTQPTVNEKDEETGGSSELKDRHVSLMEKYFSTANSAAVARQNLRNQVPGKLSTSRTKKFDKQESKKSKVGKNVSPKLCASSAKKKGDVGEQEKKKTSVKNISDSVVKNDKADQRISKDTAETGVPKFVCGYCPQRYHNKQELLAHIQAHMVEMEGKTSIEIASGGDARKAPATTSSPSVSRDPRSSATVSSEPGASKGTSENGKVKSPGDSSIKHGQDLKQKFRCGECGQVFDSKHSLLDHVRDHTIEKPFECDICHKCFTERTSLSVHRKTHDQEKLLRCHLCSKAFFHKTDFNLHMLSHPRSNNKSSGKHAIANKKSLKKSSSSSSSDKYDDMDPFCSKKSKSFASALTGEPDIPDKTTDSLPVIVLKRGDAQSTEGESSNNSSLSTGLNDPKVSLKPITLSSHKANVKTSTVKTDHNLKQKVESPSENKAVKRGNNKMESTSEGASALKTETTSSDICTCNECPDCVTRFLQSFK